MTHEEPISSFDLLSRRSQWRNCSEMKRRIIHYASPNQHSIHCQKSFVAARMASRLSSWSSNESNCHRSKNWIWRWDSTNSRPVDWKRGSWISGNSLYSGPSFPRRVFPPYQPIIPYPLHIHSCRSLGQKNREVPNFIVSSLLLLEIKGWLHCNKIASYQFKSGNCVIIAVNSRKWPTAGG